MYLTSFHGNYHMPTHLHRVAETVLRPSFGEGHLKFPVKMIYDCAFGLSWNNEYVHAIPSPLSYLPNELNLCIRIPETNGWSVYNLFPWKHRSGIALLVIMRKKSNSNSNNPFTLWFAGTEIFCKHKETKNMYLNSALTASVVMLSLLFQIRKDLLALLQYCQLY